MVTPLVRSHCKVLWSMQLGAVIKCWGAYQKHARGTCWRWRFIRKPQTPVSHVLVEIRWLSYFQSKDRPQAWWRRWHWYETIMKPCAQCSLALLGSSDGWPIKEICTGTHADEWQKPLKFSQRTGVLINRLLFDTFSPPLKHSRNLKIIPNKSKNFRIVPKTHRKLLQNSCRKSKNFGAKADKKLRSWPVAVWWVPLRCRLPLARKNSVGTECHLPLSLEIFAHAQPVCQASMRQTMDHLP